MRRVLDLASFAAVIGIADLVDRHSNVEGTKFIAAAGLWYGICAWSRAGEVNSAPKSSGDECVDAKETVIHEVADAQINQTYRCVSGQHVWFVHEGSRTKICTKCGLHREALVRNIIAAIANPEGGRQ